MEKELLPLGTVVNLKDSSKAMMICGYCSVGVSNPQKMYEYSGFVYPEGYTNNMKIYQFDSNQIESIQALGYQDIESWRYLDYLSKNIDSIRERVSKK